MVHGLGRLMKTCIGLFPLEDPHPKKTTDNCVLRTSLIVHRHVTLGVTDRIRPQRIIVIELREGIMEPTRVPLKSIGILLAWENGVPSSTIRDLVLRQCAF